MYFWFCAISILFPVFYGIYRIMFPLRKEEDENNIYL